MTERRKKTFYVNNPRVVLNGLVTDRNEYSYEEKKKLLNKRKKLNEKNKKDENDDTRKYYSDALELFNELSNKDEENEQKNNEDNLFGFGFPERYFKKNQGADTKKLNDKTGVYNYYIIKLLEKNY